MKRMAFQMSRMIDEIERSRRWVRAWFMFWGAIGAFIALFVVVAVYAVLSHFGVF